MAVHRRHCDGSGQRGDGCRSAASICSDGIPDLLEWKPVYSGAVFALRLPGNAEKTMGCMGVECALACGRDPLSAHSFSVI